MLMKTKLTKEDMKKITGGASVTPQEYCKNLQLHASRDSGTWDKNTWDARGQSWEKHCT